MQDILNKGFDSLLNETLHVWSVCLFGLAWKLPLLSSIPQLFPLSSRKCPHEMDLVRFFLGQIDLFFRDCVLYHPSSVNRACVLPRRWSLTFGCGFLPPIALTEGWRRKVDSPLLERRFSWCEATKAYLHHLIIINIDVDWAMWVT